MELIACHDCDLLQPDAFARTLAHTFAALVLLLV
jgi:hypothetical protein